MGLSIDFFYMELCKVKTQGTYFKSSGVKVFDNYGLEVVVFCSIDHRHSCLVQKYFADWKVIEA